uniref:Putative pollen receptor-like kinase 1 n=1 Tax=Davidia involucrata TaxID=16924 RepID=A0A5B6ZNF7_DAVIN
MCIQAGNNDLCGPPLGLCPSSQKLSVGTIVLLVIVMAAALVAIAAVFVILRAQPAQDEAPALAGPIIHKKVQLLADKMDEQQLVGLWSSKGKSSTSVAGNNNKLTFLRDDSDRHKFELPDLLKASAEILGSGCFGSSYKAAIMSSIMVVKRFKHMNNVSREEFQEHMRRLGKLRHPNLLPLVAFYYCREEKLLVSEYVDNVCLAVHLHSRGPTRLDWARRLKIIKGVSKGLLYLYNELPSLVTAHGHLKSSNVLLNESLEPVLTDYGLVPVVNQENAQDFMVAYKSPEYKQYNRIMKKTDVWSFGILILEILTGRFPANFLQHGKGISDTSTDLATWVLECLSSTTTCVFDKDMAAEMTTEGEMLKLLKIGLACCQTDVDKRCDLKEAIDRIQEVQEKDHQDGDFYSS